MAACVGRIPQNRLYGLGMNILKSYPEPNVNVPGANYNLETVAPDSDRNTYQHVVRIDYQTSSKLRISAKYAGQNATVQTNPGTIPGYNDNVFQFPAILVPSATVNYTLNSSTVLEGTWGLTQGNQLGNVISSPGTDPATVGLSNFPRLYQNGLVPAGSYQEKVLQEMNAPFYQNGRVVLAPSFTWGGRVANSPPSLIYPTFLCMQNTKDLAVSITKLWGSHTFKVGYQSQDSLKLQNLGTVTQGALPFEGRVSFQNDTNNPLDTGFPFANAAIGVFQNFQQQNELYEGDYRYHNKDFYIQDNWKLTPKADARPRHAFHAPRTAVRHQGAGVELLPRPMVEGQRAAPLPAGMFDIGWHVPCRQSCGDRSENGTVAWRRLLVRHRHHRAEHRRDYQRRHSSRPRDREGKLRRGLARLRAAHRRGVRPLGHAERRHSRQRWRLLRPAAG